jgi:hypothetical protein
LIGYPSRNTRFEPQISVYPVAELGENPTRTVQRLKDLLAEKPSSFMSGIPILPAIPAGQLVDAQVAYLEFGGGSGIRVLTQFAQNSWPINNADLVYVFQGLTEDDRFYISAFLPISASFLADKVDVPAAVPTIDGVSYPEFKSPDFAAEYGAYQRAILNKLNSTPLEEFQPSLLALDSLIQSLQLEQESSPQDAATLPCVNGLPTRLHLNGFAYVNADPPVPNNLRGEAGKDHPLVGEIQPGEAVKILEGPKCADGWVWWRVRSFDSELTGWTAEGDTQDYWLVPCPSRKDCGPT